MTDMKALTEAVHEYEQTCRNPDLPAFEISPVYDTQTNWDTGYPFGDRAGCYAFFDANKKLVYIGKASLSHILGRRIDSYFLRSGSSPSAVLKHQWESPPRYIVSIAVSKPYEAPSLEEFLIDKLQPSENLRGRH